MKVVNPNMSKPPNNEGRAKLYKRHVAEGSCSDSLLCFSDMSFDIDYESHVIY